MSTFEDNRKANKTKNFVVYINGLALDLSFLATIFTIFLFHYKSLFQFSFRKFQLLDRALKTATAWRYRRLMEDKVYFTIQKYCKMKNKFVMKFY